ncbi:hypothetical protein DPEC_G00311800 [Dallia pectoralis]|uniref:Uncharacterized protein n=1 Tax=Dallia pectoralis TaxID=75939 RepID=A0ACC2FBP3_DALPE|nr:hypothetical protein DPEC_G00311800 [Dallia pectoralis]
MSELRVPVLTTLLVLLLTADVCEQNGVRVTTGASAEAHTDGRNLLELVMTKVRLTQPPRQEEMRAKETKEKKEVERVHHGEHKIKVFPRDLKQRDKFIQHLTGPLYFNPKCRKHFYRLYHNTRDCTSPAFYKRCARLLTRLAGSQRCTER